MVKKLDGSLCRSCGEIFYARRRTCPRCGSKDLAVRRFSGKGDVYSYTIVRESPAMPQGQVPYAVALVHLAEGPYVTAQLIEVDMPTLFIGLPVEAVADGRVCTFRPRRSFGE
jgi:uncharacterized OB-fold protein